MSSKYLFYNSLDLGRPSNLEDVLSLRYFLIKYHLLHLNGSWWLTRNVVNNTADTINLVTDSGHDTLKEIPIESVSSASHEISSLNGSESNDLLVDSVVTHDTDGLDWQESGVSLRDLVVNSGSLDLGDENVVGLAGDGDLLSGDLTEDTDGNSWTWEWVAHDKVVWDTELSSKLANLVLKQLSQWLNELETLAVHHALWETTNVVVGLDSGGWTLERDGLDNIWVKGSLEEELNLSSLWRVGSSLLNLESLSLENLNEGVSDELSLGLWVIVDALQASEETVSGIDDSQVDTKVSLESLLDLGALVQAHDTVVDENRVEAVANGSLHEGSSDGRVDATGDSSQDLSLLSDQGADSGNLLVDELGHSPVLLGTANSDGEVLEEVFSAWGVGDLWVELDAVDWLRFVCDSSEWGVGGLADGVEIWWKSTELVAMRHPNLNIVLKSSEQLVDAALLALGAQHGGSVLSVLAGNDILSVVPRDLLKTIAYTENWDTEVEHGWVDVWGALLVDGVWASGKDDTLWSKWQIGEPGRAWQHLRVDIELAETTGNKVGILRTESSALSRMLSHCESSHPKSKVRMVSKVLCGSSAAGV